jgi:hypothetical protein
VTTPNSSPNDAAKSPYTEQGFLDHYKLIQVELRKYDTVQLVGVCLNYLHAPVTKQLDYLERHPWLVLLLLKWALLDTRAFKHGRPAPSNPQTIELLRLMHDLGGKDVARMPSQFDHFRLFFRAMAYQQFIYQRQITLTAIARQKLYFGTTSPESYIRVTFLKLTAIDIPRFLGLAQALLVRFYDGNESRVTLEWFSSLHGAYSEEEIAAFLRSISKSLREVRTALLERDKDNVSKGREARSSAEYWEQSPFINYPLLKTGLAYVCWDRHVLFRCIEHYIYNLLRSHDAKLFMVHFGSLFERYVEQAITYMGLPFISESEIKNTFGEESDAIDFIIVEGDANIFVDAKGAEMSYQGKSTHESDELAKWLQTSALKAIKQAHKVLAKLPEASDGTAKMCRRKKNYLITVTYSELYVGNGRTLADAVGAAALEPLMNAVPRETGIPLANMYFMTIHKFELLAEAVRSQQVTLTKLLDHAADEDKDPVTQKFTFEQHLATANINLGAPTYLVSKAISDVDTLAARLHT